MYGCADDDVVSGVGDCALGYGILEDGGVVERDVVDVDRCVVHSGMRTVV